MTTAISGSLLREVARLFTQSQSRSVERNSKMNSQCNLLAELERSGTLAMTELGRRVGREKSWVSRSVDALATRGLVVKEPNPPIPGNGWSRSPTKGFSQSIIGMLPWMTTQCNCLPA